MNTYGFSSGSCPNEAPLDLAIEWRGAVFDLSNLVSTSVGVNVVSYSQRKGLVHSSRQLRKAKELRQLYPTETMLQSIEDACLKDTLGKGKPKLPNPLLFEQRSSFTRRTKTGPSTTYSSRDYPVDTLGPGAYEFIPEEDYVNLKPAPKRGISRTRNFSLDSNNLDTVNYGASAFEKYSAMHGPEYDSSAPRAKPDLQIEISPGIFARLRGSEETWNAIKCGNSTHTKCFSCELPLICISDAEFVICPACRVVSPIFSGSSGKTLMYPNSAVSGGVGLGMQATSY
ncbi:hypothetical protein FisN_9Lh334 [Fistulifera solaris]|uniref:Uncharacterized protein n=1 Tax=Fistulifera solaris TaxID=1519565 RepID=A0A1Z5KL64_FISSO|nr:hypothetical protein FisN_9Lh334 [Fistulifera solaris]|eukprot:GAX27019.1 hypothetical protein FisN_9Lh334 [Fistulifera solaris]